MEGNYTEAVDSLEQSISHDQSFQQAKDALEFAQKLQALKTTWRKQQACWKKGISERIVAH